jgi:hypothetical protein
LKAISDSGNKRYALINNKTFAVGDIDTVTVNGLKVQVTCIDISQETATVEVDGARQELRLPQGF